MPQNRASQKNSEAGNVFIIILVAVVLFGALIFTFSRSGSQGVNSINKQEAKIAAQEILNYARLLEGAVDRVRRNGCSETEISFENAVVGGYSNPNSPSDKSCHIFDDAGGKISFLKINDNSFEPHTGSIGPYFYFTGANAYKGIGKDCSTSNCFDLSTFALIQQPICYEINKMVGISTIPNDTDMSGNQFLGTFNNARNVLDEPASNPLVGKKFGCFYESGDGSPNHTFYSILLAR